MVLGQEGVEPNLEGGEAGLGEDLAVDLLGDDVGADEVLLGEDEADLERGKGEG